MDEYTAGLLMSLLLLLAILLDRPVRRSRAGEIHPIIQLYLLASGLLVGVGVYVLPH